MMSPAFSPPIYDSVTGLQYYPATPYVTSPPSYEVIPNRVFVGGFSVQTSECELRDFFEQYVHVREAKIVRAVDGNGKNYGFITVDSEQEADYLRKLSPDYLEFNGKSLNLGPALRKIFPKYTPEYAIATPNGLVSPGTYRFPTYPCPPPTPSYVVYPQVAPQYMYNIQQPTIPPIITKEMNNFEQQQQHQPQRSTPINSRMNIINQEAPPLNASTPMKSNGQSYPTPLYFVGGGSGTPRNNQVQMNAYYPPPSEGVYTPPQSAQSQEVYYPPTNMAAGDGPTIIMRTPQRIFTWNTPTREVQTPSSGVPKTPQRAQPAPLSTPPTLCCESASRQSSAVRRINVSDGSAKDAVQSGALPSQRAGRRSSNEGPPPVKLENRQRGPDGRFKTNENSKHYQFIRTPPSDTKSLPSGRSPRTVARSGKCVQSLTDKLANLETKCQESECIFDSGDTLSAPSTPRRGRM